MQKPLHRFDVSLRENRVALIIAELIFTFASWAGLIALMFWLESAYALAATIPVTALFLIKAFSLQHDAGHRNLFADRKINDRVGTLLSLLTLIPYRTWKDDHAIHHNSFSLTEGNEFGDVHILSTNEYSELSSFSKLLYRIYRLPIVIIGVGPLYYLFIRQRWPAIWSRKNAVYHLIFNLYFIAFWAAVIYFAPLATIITVFLTYYLYGIIGLSIFFIEHQFEGAQWETDPETWDRTNASTLGSSVIIFPRWLEWFTSNIGYHSIHHLDPKIPYHNLREAYLTVEKTMHISTISFKEALGSFKLSLTDSINGKLISFKQYEAQQA